MSHCPVPDRFTVWALLPSMPVTVSVPGRLPFIVGMKVTVILQTLFDMLPIFRHLVD